jgi:hypothetical protein
VLLPAGVVVNVLIVSVVVHEGPHDVKEKVPVAPAGNPETEYETACDVPEARAAAIPFEKELPCVTVLFPLLDKLKLKLETEVVATLAVFE